MPADDIDIRNGLKARMDTIAELTPYEYIPGQMNTPSACVSRENTKFDATMADGSDDSVYVITLFTPYADPEVAQQAMSDYLKRSGPTSVKAAIEGDRRLGGSLDGDPTLGGVVDFARVREAREEEIRQVNGNPHLCVEFVIEITG